MTTSCLRRLHAGRRSLLRGFAALFLLCIAASPAFAAEDGKSAGEDTVLWYFWVERCIQCEIAREWLAELRAAHPALVVREVEVRHDDEGRELFARMARDRGTSASWIPTFIFGSRVWPGFNPGSAAEIEREVAALLAPEDEIPPGEKRKPAPARTTVDLGPLGSVDVAAHSLIAATALIAFVDGFNPCSLWVLTVLLAMILNTHSRARIAAVGITFLVVTASIYGLFIVGLLAAFAVARQLSWLPIAVALLALGFAAVNIKDYFAFKKGISFTIPDRFKPRIYRGGRTIREDRPLPVLLGFTVVFAGGVALIELPCTAGFPMVWTSLVADAGVSRLGFGALLAVYLLIYLGVEIAILAGTLVTMRAARLQEVHGRTLKLVGGMVMAAIALVLLFDPTIMEGLAGSLAVIGGALTAAALVRTVDRRWRPGAGL